MRRTLLAVLLLGSLVAAGCGGDEGSSPTGSEASQAAAASKVDFPDGSTKTIRALRAERPEGAIFAPSVSVMRVGDNRIGFALFDESRKQVVPDAVALYVTQPDGRRLRGPFMAERHSLEVKPQFLSRQAQADLDAVNAFWTADVSFPKRGRFVVTALVAEDGRLQSTSQYELRVGSGGPPDVGH